MELVAKTLEDNVTVLAIAGGLDSSNARAFGDRVQSLIDAGRTQFILDATPLQHVSSLGVAVLLRLHGQLQPLGGDLKLANLQGTVRDVITLFQLDKLFAIFPDVEQARLAFRDANEANDDGA